MDLTGRDEVQVRPDVTEHVAIGSAHEERRIDAHGAPLPHQAQGSPFNATGLETGQEGQDAQGRPQDRASAAEPGLAPAPARR